MIYCTVLDSAAHNGLLLFAISSGLSGRRLDVGATPSHPQLQGEVVAWQCRDNQIRHHSNMVGSIEGEDQRWIRRGEGGQSWGPVGCRRWRWEKVYFTPDSTWWNEKRQDTNKVYFDSQLVTFSKSSKAELTAQSAHRSVRVAVSVTALPDVAGLELYGGLDVPHSLLTGLQMQTWEQGDATWPGCVLYTLGPS